MDLKSNTRNGTRTTGRTRKPAEVPAKHWEIAFYEEIKMKRTVEARDAVICWMRRVRDELGNMSNFVYDERLKGAFTDAEKEHMHFFLDRLWMEMSGDVERFALPAELSAVQYTPVLSRD
jgi:hypothetical protein